MTLRGTDGLESGTGIQPLVWMTDFGGAITHSVSDLADMLNVVTGIDPEDPATLRRPAGAVPADWRSVLDIERAAEQTDRLRRFGIGGRLRADSASLRNERHDRRDESALRVPRGRGRDHRPDGQLASPPTPDAPPAPPQPIPANRVRAEGWRQYIDSHPELQRAGLPDLHRGRRRLLAGKVAVRQGRSEHLRRAEARLTAGGDPDASDYRQITTTGGRQWQWTDAANVDAVVYPGLLSDTSLNDGGGGDGKVAFGRRDTPSAANGVPDASRCPPA